MQLFQLTVATVEGTGVDYTWGDTYRVKHDTYAEAKADVLGRVGVDGTKSYAKVTVAWREDPAKWVPLDPETGEPRHPAIKPVHDVFTITTVWEKGFDQGNADGYAGNVYDAGCASVGEEWTETYRAAYSDGYKDGKASYRRTVGDDERGN